MQTLYLGLDPTNFLCAGTLIHYPVIRTARIESSDLQQALDLWHEFTHAIFTSQTAVKYWENDLKGKVVIAIGEATADSLRKRGVEPLVAPQATQEGVIQLLEMLLHAGKLQNPFVFFPHSTLSREVFPQFLQRSKIRFFGLALYETILQKIEPVPDLSEVGEIVFTSPSTVMGFLAIYGAIPLDKKLTSIGPITEKALTRLYQNAFLPSHH